MGKKKKEVLDAEYIPFSTGMKEKGFNEASIAALWGVLVPFSDYAFNKAHTAAYGLVSYWTAYLKANYPAEYMAGLLTSVGDDKDKSALYLGECRRMGIKVLPPDVNDSVARFAAVGTDIRFGMAAIRNVGHNVVEAIIAAREEKGAFTSFRDFLSKCPAVVCNKRTIESLIKGGAFDGLGESRAGLLRIHEEYVDAFVSIKRQEAIGQDSLFGAFGDDDAAGGGDTMMGLTPVPTVEWDKSTLLTFEREMLGLYVSDHPLFGVEHVLQQHADTTIATLSAEDGKPEGSMVTVAGLITGLQIKRTKKGDLWAIATVEDLEGAIECLFFPSLLPHGVDDALAGRRRRRARQGQPPRRLGVDLCPGGTTLPEAHRRSAWSGRRHARHVARHDRPDGGGSRASSPTTRARPRSTSRLTKPGRTTLIKARRRVAGQCDRVALRRPQGAARGQVPHRWLTRPRRPTSPHDSRTR